jgi:hypothetical protein
MNDSYKPPLDWDALKREDGTYRVRTRNGLPFRIWTTNAKCEDGLFPVRGEVEIVGLWLTYSWAPSGKVRAPCGANLDLLPLPRTVTRWLNCYRRPGSSLDYQFSPAHYRSEEAAREAVPAQIRTYIGPVKIEFEDP